MFSSVKYILAKTKISVSELLLSLMQTHFWREISVCFPFNQINV